MFLILSMQLEITDEQKDELDKLFDYNRNRLAELKKQMEQERSELVKAFDQEHLNESTAITQDEKTGKHQDTSGRNALQLFTGAEKDARTRKVPTAEDSL